MHSRARIVTGGAIAGILGAVAVAVWFLILDAARGHALETPTMLAATMLHGLRHAGVHGLQQHQSMLQLVSEYTVLHFIAFVAFGIVGALLLEAAENEPALLLSLVIFLGAFEVFFIA